MADKIDLTACTLNDTWGQHFLPTHKRSQPHKPPTLAPATTHRHFCKRKGVPFDGCDPRTRRSRGAKVVSFAPPTRSASRRPAARSTTRHCCIRRDGDAHVEAERRAARPPTRHAVPPPPLFSPSKKSTHDMWHSTVHPLSLPNALRVQRQCMPQAACRNCSAGGPLGRSHTGTV